MLKLSFTNINENSSIVFQKSYSEHKSVAFHTWKGCYYITSIENWNHAFLINQEYLISLPFWFRYSKWKKKKKRKNYQVFKNQ